MVSSGSDDGAFHHIHLQMSLGASAEPREGVTDPLSSETAIAVGNPVLGDVAGTSF